MILLNTLEKKLDHADLPFVDFMHFALYDPDFGYYRSRRQKLGASGDFITAPELTPLFGYTVARQCAEILSKLSNPAILEFGAGSGKLAVDLLVHLEILGCLPENYFIIEISADLRARQMELITTKIPHLLSRIQWIDHWPENKLNGVIIANEVLDAMPVHRFRLDDQGLQEEFISLNAEKKLNIIYKSVNNQRLTLYIEQNLLPIISDRNLPYTSEVNLFLPGWLQECYNILNQGVVLIIDYGFPRHEYYHQDRQQGTLMCYYNHQAHTNPLINIGEQDITAHVDFTQVAEIAEISGFDIVGFTNQAAFLLANDILTVLEAMPEESLHKKIVATQAVKRLLQPQEMGELYKVIALAKNFIYPLQGFKLLDQRARL